MSTALKILALVVLLGAFLIWWAVEDTRCREAGGTFMAREFKCLDVKELNP